MHSFIKELNEYSVSRDQKQYNFQRLVYQAKLNYLKSNSLSSSNLELLVNPFGFKGLKINEEGIEEGVDVSEVYSVSLEEEKNLIKKRFDNLMFLREMNQNFETCRSLCKVPDSRMRNLNYLPEERQSCVTDCLNVRSEIYNLQKPHNTEKVFVWLA